MTTAATAQDPAPTGPWFDLPLPGAVSDLHAPTIVIGNDAAPLPVNVPARERGGRYEELEAAQVWPHLEEIVGFSVESRESGDPLWGRIAGMPSLRNTVEWSAQRFRDAGLEDVEVQEYPVTTPLWVPTSWQVTVLGDEAYGAGTTDLVLQSAFPQRPSPAIDGVLSAPLVFVGSGSAAELANVDVEGKIAVVHKKPDPSLYHSRLDTEAIVARGAVAMIHVIELPGNMISFDAGGCANVIPCFHVGGQDGSFLESVIGAAADAGQAPVAAEISLGVELRSGTTAANAVGVLRGSGRSSENIIVNAHADAWFDGASDNGDGLAVLVALARHFGDGRFRLDRDIIFVASGGHHTSGGNGPAAFVAANPDITANTVLVLNIEHVAQLNMSTSVSAPADGNFPDIVADVVEFPKAAGVSNEAPFIKQLYGEASARYGVNIYSHVSGATPGDLGGYRALGVPITQFIFASPVYHTSGDVLATISPPGLERAARFHAYFVEQVAAAPLELLQP